MSREKITIEPYAEVPDGWELTGEWAKKGDYYLSAGGGVVGLHKEVCMLYLAVRRKKRKVTVLTCRVELPEGYKATARPATLWATNSGLILSLPLVWTETTEEREW